MIQTVQKKRVLNRILDRILRGGRVPTAREAITEVSKAFIGKVVGGPLYSPIVVGPTSVVDPKTLTTNVVDVVEDINTLYEGVTVDITDNAETSLGFAVEAGRLTNRLNLAAGKIDSFLASALSFGTSVVDENLKTADKIDLSRTTTFIDYGSGKATLPPSTKESGHHSLGGATLTNESYSVTPLSSFTQVFQPEGDKVWYIRLGPKDYYSATINLTAGKIMLGHSQEIEINSIEVEAVAPLTVAFEVSTDNLNWTQVVNATSISGVHRFDFEAVWALYLRVRISGDGLVGLRHLYVRKLICSESAVFQSRALTPASNITILNFTPKESTPNGTSIEHYIGFQPEGPWVRIESGAVPTNPVVNETQTPAASGFSDAIVTGLWAYDISTNFNTPTVDLSVLNRGYQQFHVEALGYDWTSRGDATHTPELNDWKTMTGTIQSVFMSEFATGGSGSIIVPANMVAASGSFLNTYTGADSWLALGLCNGTTLVQVPSTNYRLTTYLYMDRDVVVENAAAGVFAIGTITGSATPVGWAVYVNGDRVVADNQIYDVGSIPGSGSMEAGSGKNFQVQLLTGWNRLEILLYVPSEVTVSGMGNLQVALMMRPNLFAFQLPTKSYSAGDLPLTAYPIWGDRWPMRRVSEFYLRLVTPSWDRSQWAYRLDPLTGLPTHLLLNYDPEVLNTLDGRFAGNTPALQLKYPVDSENTESFYYRAVLRRLSGAVTTPTLSGYSFLSAGR